MASQRAMRICMVAYAFYETDPRIRRYTGSLVERGDVVDVLALRRPGQVRFEVIDGVNVHRLQSRTRDEKGRFTYLFRVLRFFIRALLFLARRQFSRPYDLIHVHSVPDFLVFTALPSRLFGVPVILDIHDILPEFYASKFGISSDSLVFKVLIWTEAASSAFAHHVIVANHLWRERLVNRSVRPNKCTTICNYPDVQFFRARTRQRNDGRFLILYPGTLNEHQGLDIAVRAFAKIAAQLPGAEFYIYGEGPSRTMLVELAQELGLDGRVILHDFVPVSRIVSVMAEADLAVVPKRASSKFGNEAASTKIWEFMAVGVPVIVSRTRVDTFYFNDSVVKFFESDNEDDLAEAILTLYREPALRERLIRNARKLVEENNWQVKKREYLVLVDSLVRVGRSEPPARGAEPQSGSNPETPTSPGASERCALL